MSGTGRPPDSGRALPLRREPALDKQGSVVLRADVQLVELGVHGGAAERKPARHIGAGAAGAHKVLRRALAEQHSERVDDDRLAGARFAREDIKPLIKFDFSPFYDGDIFYIEPFEHLPAPPFPLPAVYGWSILLSSPMSFSTCDSWRTSRKMVSSPATVPTTDFISIASMAAQTACAMPANAT